MKLINTEQLKNQTIGVVYAPWDGDIETALLDLRVRDGSSKVFENYLPVTTAYQEVDTDLPVESTVRNLDQKLRDGIEVKLSDVAFSASIGFEYNDDAVYVLFDVDDTEVLCIDMNEFVMAGFCCKIVDDHIAGTLTTKTNDIQSSDDD